MSENERELTNPMTIREVTENDWQQFKAIRLMALNNEPETFADDNARNKRSYTDEVWQEKIASPQRKWLIAEDTQGTFVGIIGAIVHDPQVIEEGVAMITNVYTDKTHRGERLGKKLLSASLPGSLLSFSPE